MNIVDSSGWLEYFADGPNADFFAPAIEAVDELVVPSISIHEVFKWILRQRSDDEALQAIAVMQQGQVVNLDSAVALTAAKLSVSLGLPMADSVILATTRLMGATLWTQDADFQAVEGVQYIKRT